MLRQSMGVPAQSQAATVQNLPPPCCKLSSEQAGHKPPPQLPAQLVVPTLGHPADSVEDGTT